MRPAGRKKWNKRTSGTKASTRRFSIRLLNVLSMLGVSPVCPRIPSLYANGVGAGRAGSPQSRALPVLSLINGTGLLIGIGSATLFPSPPEKESVARQPHFSHSLFLLGAVLGVILHCAVFS